MVFQSKDSFKSPEQDEKKKKRCERLDINDALISPEFEVRTQKLELGTVVESFFFLQFGQL